MEDFIISFCFYHPVLAAICYILLVFALFYVIDDLLKG